MSAYTMHLQSDIPASFRGIIPSVAWSWPQAMKWALGWSQMPLADIGEKLYGLHAWLHSEWCPQDTPMICLDGEVFEEYTDVSLAVDLTRRERSDALIGASFKLPAANRDYLTRYAMMVLDGKASGGLTDFPSDWMSKFDFCFNAQRPLVKKIQVYTIGVYPLNVDRFELDLLYMTYYRRIVKKKFPWVRVAYLIRGSWHENQTSVLTPLPDDLQVRYGKLASRYAHTIGFELKREHAPLYSTVSGQEIH